MRRRKGVKRSLDADLSVIALGPQADAVIGVGLTGKDPTGPDSPFQRVIELGGALSSPGAQSRVARVVSTMRAEPDMSAQVVTPAMASVLRLGF